MRLLVLGFGNVGRALCQILPAGFDVSICSSKGGILEADLVSLGRAAKANKPLNAVPGFAGLDPLEAVHGWDYDVLVDLSPTNLETAEPSASYWLEAFGRGKHVVTANKGPLALNYGKMGAAAEKNGVSLLFEATVAGGTPVFSFARNCLNGGKLSGIEGILNGTSNYILTKMAGGVSFAEALCDAQDKGYAEANPSYDVDGKDALAKAVILANALFGRDISFKGLKAEGIRNITPEMVRQANHEGKCYKLVATIDAHNLSVKPQCIPKSHPLANVGDAWNALTFYTEHADAITITGKGAGGLPTASAVLNDILELKE